MGKKRLLRFMFPIIAVMIFAMFLTGCTSGSDEKLIDLQDPVTESVYYIRDSRTNYYYQDHTQRDQAVDEFTDSITALRNYLDGESFVDTGYYMGVNYDIDLVDPDDNYNTVANFQLRVDAYLYTYPYEDENGNPIYKYYENGTYYDTNNPAGTRTLVNALEIHNEAIKKSDISIEWYNGATNEVMIGLYFDGINSNSDNPGNILYADIQGARRSFPEFGDTVLFQQMIRLLVHLSVDGLLTGLGLQNDAGTGGINKYMKMLITENYKRVVNDPIVSLLFYSVTLDAISEKATLLLQNLFGPFGRKWDPLTYKYLGFRFSSVATSNISTILGDMQALISPDKENVNNVLTNAIFDLSGKVMNQRRKSFDYRCHVTFDYGWVYPDPGIEVDHKDWYKEFDYGKYEFKGKLYVPSWDAQYDALIRTDMNSVDNTTNNVFIEFRDIANGELAIGVYYKNERSYLDIKGLSYMYGWIDLEYLGFPQVYDEHLDLAYVLKRFKILINNVIVSIVDGILDPASSDRKNKALEYIMEKTSITEKIEFSTADEAKYRETLLNSAEVAAIRSSMAAQYDENYIREYIEEYVYQKVLEKKQESLFSANTETLLVDIELIKQMLEETGAGTFTTRQLITIIDSVLPYTLDQLAIMLGIPSAELMVEKTYFTFTLDVDTNLMTMKMFTNLGIQPGEPSNLMWQLELTPTHFGERVPIAEVDFSKFKPLEQIYTYSGTLNGSFVFSSQEKVDLSKLLSATIGESSGLNTPYALDNNTSLSFTLIYDQFVTDNYVDDDGKVVPEDDPTGTWKREGRSAFDLSMSIMGDADALIIRLCSDDVSFNNEVYKKLNSKDPQEKSDAEHQMGYIWVDIACVTKNGKQAIPKVKIREDVFMASMSAYMKGETSISDDVESFADSDFNLSLTSIISAICKDAYVVPEAEVMSVTSSNDTLQSLFRVKGLIGDIDVNAGFTYRVKGLQRIKKEYYMYEVGFFEDIVGVNPYTTELHHTLHTGFYTDYRDGYGPFETLDPLDYDFYVFHEDAYLEDEEAWISEGTIMVFELGAKKTLTRQPIADPEESSQFGAFFRNEPAENKDINEVRFPLSELGDIVTMYEGKYYYSTYYNKRVEIDEDKYVDVINDEIYIKWQGLRDIVFYDKDETYYYFDMTMAMYYTEEMEDDYGYHRIGDYIYIYEAEYRNLLFEYDPDSVDVTADCKIQYSPRTNGSFMGVTRRYYLTLTSRTKAELGSLHSVYYDEISENPQYYSEEDEYNTVYVYNDDGEPIDCYYDPIALFVMEPAEPLITSYRFRVCTDPQRKTNIEQWSIADHILPDGTVDEPRKRNRWEYSSAVNLDCRFVINWVEVTLKGYMIVTDVIVAEGMMGETIYPVRIIVTNREVDTEERAAVFDADNYYYRVVDASVAVEGSEIPENTYYVLSGDQYLLTTDPRVVEGTVYYEKIYYEENVPVVYTIDLDPYEYLLAKYEYLSNPDNFSLTGYQSAEEYQAAYDEAEKRFISDYFSQYAFEIIFAWERSILYREKVQDRYIAKRYSNQTTYTDDNGDTRTTFVPYVWSFDVSKDGINVESVIKASGGYVYLHTRFYGQLIAMCIKVGARKFSYVKFNTYDSYGNLVQEDTFNPNDYADTGVTGKYTANYYDGDSYTIGTQPVFVFLDDKGDEYEIRFNMEYISGLRDRTNYNVVSAYDLDWSDPVITNVGSNGSYFMEYVYAALYKQDSATATVRPVSAIDVRYEGEGAFALSETVRGEKIGGENGKYLYRKNAAGYAETLVVNTYSDEKIALKTYNGEYIAYTSLPEAMRAISVTVRVGGSTETRPLYTSEAGTGYAMVYTAYEYGDDYTSLLTYGYLPMDSENYSLVLSNKPVYYNNNGSTPVLSAEQKNVRVSVDGVEKTLYADTDRDGFAEKLVAEYYEEDLFEPLLTEENELIPYKSLTAEQKAQRVRTRENGETVLLYRNRDGHAEIRIAKTYGNIYKAYTISSFEMGYALKMIVVLYDDLTDAEKNVTVNINGEDVRLYGENNVGGATIRVAVYGDDTDHLRTVSGEKVFYKLLSDDMRSLTVLVGEEEKPLYMSDAEGYTLVRLADHYLAQFENNYVRYEFADRANVDFDEDVAIYNESYEDYLFRWNEKTGLVEIRRATVYREGNTESTRLKLTVDGAQLLLTRGIFSDSELERTVTVEKRQEQQYYLIPDGYNYACVRLGYWYTEGEWETFTVNGRTYTSLDSLSDEMRNKKVIVRKKDYTVELFRVNDGRSELAQVLIDGARVSYSGLTDGEKGSGILAKDVDGDYAAIPVGGYFTEETEYFTIQGHKIEYSKLSEAMKNLRVKRVLVVGDEADADFRLGVNGYVVGEDGLLFSEDGEGYALALVPQTIVEVRKPKTAGTDRYDLRIRSNTLFYSELTRAEAATGLFAESLNHTVQLIVGGLYEEEWMIFTVSGYAYVNTDAFAADMMSITGKIRPAETEGKLYKTNAQGYVLIRDRSEAYPTELTGEQLWVEYGVGYAQLFKRDSSGYLTVRSDEKVPVNRPFYYYYIGDETEKKLVYIGNEYRYEYKLDTTYNRYDDIDTAKKEEFILNDAGDAYPTYVPFDCLVEEIDGSGERTYYYDPTATHTERTARAYKRQDITLDSSRSHEIATATINFYTLLRMYTYIDGSTIAVNVVDGQVVLEEIPGASSRTNYPSITVRVIAECPKQDPLVSETAVTDRLNDDAVFFPTEVLIGDEVVTKLDKAQQEINRATDPETKRKKTDAYNKLFEENVGYYKVDPLRQATATLPDSITVFFEGGGSHIFTDLEWFAYYDEMTGEGSYLNQAGVQIIEKQTNGTYLVVIPLDERTTTKVMTRIGNEVSGYKYISVALVVLSKDPTHIVFYENAVEERAGRAYDIEQHEIETTQGSKEGSAAYYTYYANTFDNIVLPTTVVATFNDGHTTQYDDVTWKTTTGEKIAFVPGTSVRLVSVIRETGSVTKTAISGLNRETLESEMEGWYISSIRNGSFVSSRYNDRLFLSQVTYNSDGQAIFLFGDFTEVSLYRPVDLTIYLDVMVYNDTLQDLQLFSQESLKNSGNIYNRYVLVNVEGEYEYVQIKDLVQWNFEEPTKVGLYYREKDRFGNVLPDGKSGYIVISSGSDSDRGVKESMIGIFTQLTENVGGVVRTTYDSSRVMTVQEFINEIYKEVDIGLTRRDFDYSIPYANVEVYREGISPTWMSIDSFNVSFKSYETEYGEKITYTFDMSAGGYLLNVSDSGTVRVKDESGTITKEIALTDFIAMLVDRKMTVDFRTWNIVGLTLPDGSVSRAYDEPLSSYANSELNGGDFLAIELSDGVNTLRLTQEEFLYRRTFLNKHMNKENRSISIYSKSISVNDLDKIMNVNDMIAYGNSGVSQETDVDHFEIGKYLIALGTGMGAYDINPILVFRGGYYYDAGSGSATQSEVTSEPLFRLNMVTRQVEIRKANSYRTDADGDYYLNVKIGGNQYGQSNFSEAELLKTVNNTSGSSSPFILSLYAALRLGETYLMDGWDTFTVNGSTFNTLDALSEEMRTKTVSVTGMDTPQPLFRLNSRSNVVEIRRANVYLSNTGAYYLPIRINGRTLRPENFSSDELNRKVRVNSGTVTQSYIVFIESTATENTDYAFIRLGTYYSESEWEVFTINGRTFDSLDSFSAEMRNKTVLVAKTSTVTVIEQYTRTGTAQYAAGYNLGENIYMTLAGVKTAAGGTYSVEADKKFTYGSDEKLTYWYVQASTLPGIEVGSRISYIPPEAIYRTGDDSGGTLTLSTVTSEGFYLTKTFLIDPLPDHIDSDSEDAFFSSSSFNGSESFVIKDGLIEIENIYEYDNNIGLDRYFIESTYLPKSIIVYLGEDQDITVNNVSWHILEDEWKNSIYQNMDYHGTDNQPYLFAEAYILGYRSSGLAVQGQIRLLVRIKIASAEIETLLWDDEASGIKLSSDVYLEEGGRHFTVYVDAYNSADSEALRYGTFTLPSDFTACTVDGLPFKFENVEYRFGLSAIVTKVYYDVSGIDIVRMTASGSELNGNSITNKRELNLFGYIGKGKTRQRLNFTFYFYDKEATYTEAVLTLSDEGAREQVKEILKDVIDEKESAMIDKVNVKRLKTNLEILIDEAQKLQSDILANKLPAANRLTNTSLENIRLILVSGIPYGDTTFKTDVLSYPTDSPWSVEQCRAFARYYLREAAEEYAVEYGNYIYKVSGSNVSVDTKYTNINKYISEYASTYSAAAYSKIIEAYMEIEFNKLFYSYMRTEVGDSALTNAVLYKNSLESNFDTEFLLEEIRKVRRLFAKGSTEQMVELYVKQFDLTYVTQYGMLPAGGITGDDQLISCLIKEEIIKSIIRTDAQYGLRASGRFNAYGNEDLLTIRYAVIETFFLRAGLKTVYTELSEITLSGGDRIPEDTYSPDENGIYVLVTGVAQSDKRYYTLVQALPFDLRSTGAYTNGSYVMPSALACTFDGLIAAGFGDYTSGELRSAINAVVERWFDFSERKPEGYSYFTDLADEIVRYSFTSINRYESSVLSIRRSIVNGTDFTSALNTLMSRAIESFLDTVFAEERCVFAIRQARKLNEDMAKVFVLPTSALYNEFLKYYAIESVSETEFYDSEIYEQDVDGYYYRTTDTVYDPYKSYYRFTLVPSDMRYYPVTFASNPTEVSETRVLAGTTVSKAADGSPLYYVSYAPGSYTPTLDIIFVDGTQYYYYGDAMKRGGDVPVTTVYREEENVNFQEGENYYRFVKVTVITDQYEDVVFVGDAIEGDVYEYNSAQSHYYPTSDGHYSASDVYYKFITYGGSYNSSEHYYEQSGSYFIPYAGSGFEPGHTYYIRKNVYVVSSAETATVKVDMPISGIGYYRRTMTKTQDLGENDEIITVYTYGNPGERVFEYYEKNTDGSFRLTSDTVFKEEHTYYARQLLRGYGEEKNRDYVVGSDIASWIVVKNYVPYVEESRSALFISTSLYRADAYYLYNYLPTTYNIVFDELYGGPSYRSTKGIKWNQTINGKSTYEGMATDITATLDEGTTGDKQQLNQKVKIIGHSIEEQDLILYYEEEEAALSMFEHTGSIESWNSGSAYAALYRFLSKTTGSVRFRRLSDEREFSVTFVQIGDVKRVSTVIGYDDEGYAMFCFTNTYDTVLGTMKQSISIFNPFEFRKSYLPSVIRSNGVRYDVVWNNLSILPSGNLSAENPLAVGNIHDKNGQTVTLSMYVASWSFSGIYQVTTQSTELQYEVNGEQYYFAYMDPVNCYFSDYSAYAACDMYLLDFGLKIKREDSSGNLVTTGFTLTRSGEIIYNSSTFVRKVFYPTSQGLASGLNVSSRLLEYGDLDSSMKDVLKRRNYLLYWDGTALSSVLSDERHAPKTGSLSIGNDTIGNLTIKNLRATGSTAPMEAVYMYESMNIDSLQMTFAEVTPRDIVVETDATTIRITMAYYDLTYVLYASGGTITGGKCPFDHSLGSIARSGDVYTFSCSVSSCLLYHTHELQYNRATGECLCIGDHCACALYDEVASTVVGKSGQVPLVVDIFSTYPMTANVKLLENNIKYKPEEISVRLLWNQDFTTVINNLTAFVREKYPDVDSSAREIFATNLLIHWTEMTESEREVVIRLAKEYCTARNADGKTAYTDAMATRDAYRLLAINERYDYVANPAKLTGGADTGVTATVLILASGSSTVYRQTVSVRVLFSDYHAEGFYVYNSASKTYQEYTVTLNPSTKIFIGNTNTYYEEVRVTSSMTRQAIPANTYFIRENGAYKLVGGNGSTFVSGVAYYRMKTSSLYASVLSEYWMHDTRLGVDEYKDYYEYFDKMPPYDNVGDSAYKLMQLFNESRIGSVDFEPIGISGVDYHMVKIDNIYWTYNETEGKMVSSSFNITLNGITYTIYSDIFTISPSASN